MYVNQKRFIMKTVAIAAVISSAVVLGAVASANAEPGKANPKGNPNCDGNTPITSPAKKCNGNNGFGNGGNDGTPNGKQDDTR
jgi:hypothetical protein